MARTVGTTRKKVTSRTTPKQEAALRAALAGVPEAVADATLRFAPLTVSDVEFAAVRSFVIRAIAAFGTTSVPLLNRQLTALTRYAVWCREQGVPLTIARVFDPSRVEQWSALGMKGKHRVRIAPGTLREYVTRLRHMGRTLTPDAAWPVFRETGQRKLMRGPYTSRELETLATAIRQLRNGFARERFALMVALGLGCGPTPAEYNLLRGSDFEVERDGALVVHIPGPKARTVPIVAKHAPVIRAAAEKAGDGYLLKRGNGKNYLAQELRRQALGKGVPRIALQRLRTTWITQRLAAGVDPRTLLYKYAGLASLNQLILVVEFLAAPDPERDRRRMTKTATHD